LNLLGSQPSLRPLHLQARKPTTLWTRRLLPREPHRPIGCRSHRSGDRIDRWRPGLNISGGGIVLTRLPTAVCSSDVRKHCLGLLTSRAFDSILPGLHVGHRRAVVWPPRRKAAWTLLHGHSSICQRRARFPVQPARMRQPR